MQISDIILEGRGLVDADSVSYTDAVILRRLNAYYEEIIGKLIALDKNWDFGDSNYSFLPTGTQNLTAETQAYSFDTTLLALKQVQVKDASGIWHLLNPINYENIGVPIEEYQKDNGLPTEYAKRENFLLLFPAPATADVTLTLGLKVVFQRTADIFTSAQVTTGTKVPGFASPFHILLAYKLALPFAMAYKKDRVAGIMAEIEKIEGNESKRIVGTLEKFYTSREKDVKRGIMSMGKINFR